MEKHQDLALVIAWPDKTARGDERWMALLKQLGVVKNLNFRVGHAAIILINRQSGTLSYYDFGRYVTPRGYGRARSSESDPRLALNTQAQFDNTGTIQNLQAITAELHQMEYATHGGGRLFFSLAKGISYAKSTRFARRIVESGPVKYGAIAKDNNSCSRFVAQVLLAGLTARHPARRRVGLPESLKASPMSNVVNASPNKIIYRYHEGSLASFKMNRWQSLHFQVDLLLHNLSTTKAKALPCDREPGNMAEPERPSSIPKSAQWLGGIGEGAWYFLDRDLERGLLLVVKYAVDGNEDYRASCMANQQINLDKPYRFTYHCHYQCHQIVQHEKQIRLDTIDDQDWNIRIA
ncbi:DUF6695 family protein [Parapedobacter sp. DT-150]|uniref:DUF6695 family protein n=1 Tax=Parapedobacter sp. DT-150 TaxID=3396162 RepID=UPI003F1A9A07